MTAEVKAARGMALRQRLRLTFLYLMLITFPITLNYFSVYLIIEGSSQGIAVFSFFFWTAWVVAGFFFGRAACGYACPLGAIQEVRDRMGGRMLWRIRYFRWVKYLLAVAWVGGIAAAAIAAGGYRKIELLYNMPQGISVDSIQSLFMFFTVVLAVLIPSLILGKRGFCHYLCPWGVLNIVGTKVKGLFRWPSLHLRPEKEKCKQCRTCDNNCPMSLGVSRMVASGSMRNTECILCGTCVDTCPNGTIKYSWRRVPKVS
ncbi:MAG: 4Fe-4S binding protein [Chloroflexota bacterium]